MARLLAVVLCILGISSPSFANGNKANWANLSAVQAGERIQVVETNSKKASGTFVNFSDTSVTVETASGRQVIPMEKVRSVKVEKSSHRLRNTLLFGAVGAGAGAGIGAAAGSSSAVGGKGLPALVGGVLGFVGGAVVGLVWPSHKTIYQRPAN